MPNLKPPPLLLMRYRLLNDECSPMSMVEIIETGSAVYVELALQIWRESWPVGTRTITTGPEGVRRYWIERAEDRAEDEKG